MSRARKGDVIHAPGAWRDRLSDRIAGFAGSWTFIALFAAVLVLWMVVNTVAVLGIPRFDRPPFIGLNLFLSFTAAFQAPFILMAANRQAAKDHVRDDLEADEVARLLALNETQLAILHQQDAMLAAIHALTTALAASGKDAHADPDAAAL